MTIEEPQTPPRTHAAAAPLAGRLVWWSALVAALFLACGVWFGHLEGGLERPFRFPSADGVSHTSSLCFALGIGILLSLPVLRDLLVFFVSLRHKQRGQALLAALGAGGLLFVYGLLWLFG